MDHRTQTMGERFFIDYRNAVFAIRQQHPAGRFFRMNEKKNFVHRATWEKRESGESDDLLDIHWGLFSCVPSTLGYAVVDIDTRDDAHIYGQVQRIMGAPTFRMQTPRGGSSGGIGCDQTKNAHSAPITSPTASALFAAAT